MKRILLIATAAVALGAAGVIAAETAAPDHHRDGRQMRLMEYDQNKDGNITRAEVDAGVAVNFKTADKDGNGSVNEDEFKAYHADRRAAWKSAREAAGDTKPADGDKDRAGRHGRRGDRGDAFKRVDWNLDGSLSLEEFAGRSRSMVARIDRDGDGTVTAEERERRGHGPRDKDGAKAPKATEQ